MDTPEIQIIRKPVDVSALSPALLERMNYCFGQIGAYTHPAPLAGPGASTDPPMVSALTRYIDGVFSAFNGSAAVRPAANAAPRKVFISYAHADGRAYMERLQTHLKGVFRTAQELSQIDYWSDQRLTTGVQWRPEIEAALSGSACAVLILTPSFLASDFINQVELPALLLQREVAGMSLYPIQAIQCAWPDG